MFINSIFQFGGGVSINWLIYVLYIYQTFVSICACNRCGNKVTWKISKATGHCKIYRGANSFAYAGAKDFRRIMLVLQTFILCFDQKTYIFVAHFSSFIYLFSLLSFFKFISLACSIYDNY